MEKSKPTTSTALSPATSPAASGSSVPVLLLEDRVARLEEAVAALAELQHWEDNPTSSSTAIPQEAEVVRATPIPPPPTASLAEFTIPSLNTTSPSPGLPNLLQPVKAALPFTAQLVNRVLPASSLWRDIWWDLHTFWRMLRDPFYPKTTTFKIVPLFAIFYVTIWPWFSSWGGLLGTLMSYVVNGVVLYIAFKVVQRELRRYYDFAEKYHKNR